MSAHETAAASSKYQPSDFLKAVLGRPVIVKLNSGVSYRGILACLDGYMNIAMEQTEEYVARRRRTTRRASLLRGATPDPIARLFVGRRSAESQVRRLLHPRQQRALHQHDSTEGGHRVIGGFRSLDKLKLNILDAPT